MPEELVDELFDIVNDRNKGDPCAGYRQSAIRENLADEITSITAPTLLIWGNNDTITPPFVGRRIP